MSWGEEQAQTLEQPLHFWGALKNPLSNQILMNTERPKFQGTAENYAEFKRGWNEYHRIIKANSPGTNEGQILHFFQTCLDEETALQLKREIEANPRITVAHFLKIMEKRLWQRFFGPVPG